MSDLLPSIAVRSLYIDHYEFPLQSMLLSMVPLLGLLAGVGLMLLPMRKRHGYRGLHEFLSGTRVVLLPLAARRAALQGEPFDPPLRPAEGCPQRLGAFVIRGALPGAAGTTVLVGQDAVLGRDVWIWLRPLSKPPLSDARRRLSRTGRLRWLSCGTHGDLQWDAFTAPAGSPLTEVVRRKGRFAWPEVRSLLEGLADELVTAGAEGTLPDALWPEQVWIQPNGAVQLLEMPWWDGEPAVNVPATEADPSPRRLALVLLGRAAALALEGVPRPAGAIGPVRAPLPRHAAELLADLLAGRGSAANVQAALRKTRDRPAEVTRARRVAHLGVLTALLFVGAGCCMFPVGWAIDLMPGMMQPVLLDEQEKTLRDLDDGAWLDFAAGGAGAGPACWPALGQLHDNLTLRERLREKIEVGRRRAETQLELLSPITREQVLVARKSTQDQMALMENDPRFQDLAQYRHKMYRLHAEQALTAGPELSEIEAAFRASALVSLLAWPTLWVVWAFLWRGGFSYRFVQIDVVRSDGRPAGRFQCAWRALLVWAPVTSLLALSLVLQTLFWSDWNRGDVRLWLHALSTAVWYGAVVLLAVYAALAIARPTRSLHDRLAGTYLMPR